MTRGNNKTDSITRLEKAKGRRSASPLVRQLFLSRFAFSRVQIKSSSPLYRGIGSVPKPQQGHELIICALHIAVGNIVHIEGCFYLPDSLCRNSARTSSSLCKAFTPGTARRNFFIIARFSVLMGLSAACRRRGTAPRTACPRKRYATGSSSSLLRRLEPFAVVLDMLPAAYQDKVNGMQSGLGIGVCRACQKFSLTKCAAADIIRKYK